MTLEELDVMFDKLETKCNQKMAYSGLTIRYQQYYNKLTKMRFALEEKNDFYINTIEDTEYLDLVKKIRVVNKKINFRLNYYFDVLKMKYKVLESQYYNALDEYLGGVLVCVM